MSRNRKLTAIILSTALVAILAVTAVFAAYPASVEEGVAASADAEVLTGTLIGLEEGWDGNPNTGRDAAFDGDIATFFDPLGTGDGFCGIELSEPRELVEIRIHPRGDRLERFNGASIYGFNEGYNPDDTGVPAGAVLIWESMEVAEAAEFYVIKADEFTAEAKGKAFKYYIYYNNFEHGDVAEVEFWGKATAADAPVIEETPAVEEAAPVEEAPAEEDTPVAVEETAETVAPATTSAAPQTGDNVVLFVIIAIASICAGVVVSKKFAKGV